MSDSKKITVAVIGAGPMGLMCAYRLLQQGYAVTIFERDDRIGGMTAAFDFDGLQIERFYHFVCATDEPTFALLKELDIFDKLKWRITKMGFYYDGKLYPWGDPISLLKFPKLNFIEKFRYGLMVMYAKSISNWTKLDKVYATTWLKKWCGEKAYNVLWKPLFTLKFDKFENDLSAAWLGTRIKRVALSRKSIFEERMGYLEGGSETLLVRMREEIEKLGGKIQLRANVSEIVSEQGAVKGIQVNGEFLPFVVVVSTVPLPYVPALVPGLSEKTKKQIAAIDNVGVVCVLFKLKKQLTENFWLNINDPSIEIPGIIEYTNLQQYPDKIVYAPYYMSHEHAKYKWTNEQFVNEVKGYLKKVNPEFSEEWILGTHVARYSFAQTVCTPNFYEKLPPMKSELKNFYMADTAYYYPEDRSIAESIKVGEDLAKLVIDCNNHAQ
ncbi:MAG: NAD(P)/FAD-dependent oxidoreductase [Gammaproteobacteria bacterium]|nr:NAD(P)/FAD-dependent oxidoreductase [Gammaproteobacteria bacterium]